MTTARTSAMAYLQDQKQTTINTAKFRIGIQHPDGSADLKEPASYTENTHNPCDPQSPIIHHNSSGREEFWRYKQTDVIKVYHETTKGIKCKAKKKTEQDVKEEAK